jgi:hypothetical protein
MIVPKPPPCPSILARGILVPNPNPNRNLSED